MNTISILILVATEQQSSLDGDVLQIVVTSCATIFTLIELTCYLVIFHHLYRHDNGNIKKFLTKESIRHRNRRNAITFLGQFWGFTTEFSAMVILTATIALGGTDTQFKAVTNVLKMATLDGILPMVEVLVSEQLRNDFIESMFTIIEKMFFMFIWL